MKKLLFFLLPLLIVGCKKETTDKVVEKSVYLFRLKAVNVDETLSYSNIQVVRNESNSGYDRCENEEDGSESEYCYCKRHPEDKKCKSLPIQLEYFTVNKSSCCLVFEWKTSYEQSVKSYTIEISKDEGKSYSVFASEIPAKGAGVYKFVH